MKRFLILMLLTISSHSQYIDYSNKSSKNNILNNILLVADSVVYTGDTLVKVIDNDVNMNRFRIYATAVVQTVCYVTHGDYDTTKVIYEMLITKDSNFITHDYLIDTIYNFWKVQDKEFWDGAYLALPVPVGIFYSKKNYVLYMCYLNNRTDNYYYLWFDNRVIKLYEVYVFKGGLGTGGFMNQNMRFKFDNTEIKPNYKSDFSPYKFEELYGKGFFRKN